MTIERLYVFGRFGMLALLYVFLFYIAIILARSSSATAAGQQANETSRRRGGLALRLLQGEGTVWVKGVHEEESLEAGGVISGRGELSIGRAPGNDIRLEDPFSSAFHACLRQQRQGILVEDLGTTNGTRVNGIRIRTPVRVEPGDIIDIGSTSFAVE